MELFELTRSLIDIPSLSGDEIDVGMFLAKYLQDKGYIVDRQVVSDGRANIIATTGHPARVVLSTHMDTVPPFIGSSEDAEHIYGRGACDAKGIIAAQILAADRLCSRGINEIGLLFTVDEEQGSIGARAANAHQAAQNCEFLINGEPTDNLLAIGSKGSLRVRLETKGTPAHSAYPEQGRSAIEPLLDVLQDLRQVDWPSDDFFGETTCNIGVIQGGTRSNVIPANAYADIHIRLVCGSDRIKAILDQVVSGRANIELLSAAEPVRMFSAEGFQHSVVRFTTDIPYLTNWGTPLLLGPGSILLAHTEFEKVPKNELVQSVDLYEALILKLLG